MHCPGKDDIAALRALLALHLRKTPPSRSHMTLPPFPDSSTVTALGRYHAEERRRRGKDASNHVDGVSCGKAANFVT